LVGFAVVVVNDNEILWQKVFHSKLKGVERLNDIITYIDDVFTNLSGKEVKYDAVIFEGYSFGSRGQATFSIAELGGVLRMFFFQKGITPMIVPPTVLKKFVTGKGVAPKEIMIKEVFRKWKFDTNDNNLADAYSLMKFGEAALLISQGKTENYTKAEIEVVTAWKNSKMVAKIENEAN